MAHKKSAGSVLIHPGRPGKRMGIKLYAGQKVRTGGIIVRQKGMTIKAGDNVKTGRDYTLYAIKEGIVNFKKKLSKVVVFIK